MDNDHRQSMNAYHLKSNDDIEVTLHSKRNQEQAELWDLHPEDLDFIEFNFKNQGEVNDWQSIIVWGTATNENHGENELFGIITRYNMIYIWSHGSFQPGSLPIPYNEWVNIKISIIIYFNN